MPKNGVIAAQHLRRLGEISLFHRLADRRAAHHRPVHAHGRNSNDVKIKTAAKFFEKIEIARAVFSERPFVTDANLAQRLRIHDQLLDKMFWRGGGKLSIELDHEQMSDTERANERDLVLRGREQMRRRLRPQDFLRMRIECDDDRRSIRGMGVARGSGNDRLMAAMNAVEYADGQKNRPAQLAQLRNRPQKFP